MTILVSIVAYRDPLLPFTIARALATAARPGELRFGIVEQADATTTYWGARPPGPVAGSYVRIEPQYARGPCWARAIAQSFYAGEDWFLQIDSHTDFDDGWDERLITQAQAIGPKAVLSTYPGALTFDGDRTVRHAWSGAFRCGLRPESHFVPESATLHFRSDPIEADRPIPAFHVGGNCLFAPGRYCVEFPYDPRIYFHGEEQAIAIRLFTHGWDIFHPVATPIYHVYGDRPTGAPPRPLHETQHATIAATLEVLSRRRLVDLVSGMPLGAFGLGSERSIADFAAFSGIDYAGRAIEPRAYGKVMPGEVAAWENHGRISRELQTE